VDDAIARFNTMADSAS